MHPRSSNLLLTTAALIALEQEPPPNAVLGRTLEHGQPGRVTIFGFLRLAHSQFS
jgi:hypothetical protein